MRVVIASKGDTAPVETLNWGQVLKQVLFMQIWPCRRGGMATQALAIHRSLWDLLHRPESQRCLSSLPMAWKGFNHPVFGQPEMHNLILIALVELFDLVICCQQRLSSDLSAGPASYGRAALNTSRFCLPPRDLLLQTLLSGFLTAVCLVEPLYWPMCNRLVGFKHSCEQQ